MKKKRRRIGDYVHTGGFNRLAGVPDAPGSVRPERYIRRWRIILLCLGTLFLLAGGFFVIF